MTIDKDWTWQKAVQLAEQRLIDRGLSKLSRPEYDYIELGSIDEVEGVGETALANIAWRHSAWYSYASVELAYSRSAFHALDEIYDTLLGEAMNKVAKTQDSKMVKDILKGIAIQTDEPLKRYFRKRIELQQEMNLLEGMVNGLAIRCKAIESELIRRASLRKIEGGMSI